MWSFKWKLGLVAVALGFVFGLGAPAMSQEAQVIRLICLPGVPLPVVIANRNGLFAKYGVKVETAKPKDAAALRTALMNGTADLAHSSVENAVVMADAEQADVAIVFGGEQATSELIVQPEIKSVAELRGKAIILDGPDTAYMLTCYYDAAYYRKALAMVEMKK